MTKTIDKICVDCEKENIEWLDYDKEVEIRGEKFIVKTGHWHCKDCDSYWRTLGENDYMKEVLQLYREKYNILKPEEIKEERKKYGFTQSELAEILNCATVSISRYERGSLPLKSHERMLKLLKDPDKFYEFINNSELNNKEKYLEKVKKFYNPTKEQPLVVLENLMSSYKKDEFAGFQKPDIEKIRNVIRFFCIKGLYTTKLNKLLFFSDFKYFKEKILSLTGIRYRRIQYGPVPEYYGTILEMLVAAGELEVEITIDEEKGSISKFYKSLKKPDLSVFSKDEAKVLYDVEREFEHLNASGISDESHEEKAWIETEDKALISYEHAFDLNI